jgi:neutral trehalase
MQQPAQGTEQMKLTLIQASEVTGKDRSTLYRAIKKGKLSGELQDDKSYLVDRSELFRVYPESAVSVATHKDATVAMQQLAQDAQGNAQAELIEALRTQIDLLKGSLTREQENADHWRNQATMLLTHQPPIETASAKKEDPEVTVAEETNNVVIDEFADETLTQRLIRKLFW